ncbi:uncharacterized protein [Apostichopus japonicus]|uniref:uncharacterized protein isoform X9 n=1 Tax=Stichopus japonicus TaxID=307972 RepID=UPI003AB78EEC
MERALEVFQPFLFLKMDVNITDCVDNAYNSLVSESIELRFKHNQAMQWKGLLKCSNHSFSLRWTLISLAMERALEVFQPFLFLKMDVNITVSGDNRFAMERAPEVFQPFLFLEMDVNITGNGKGSGSVPTIPLPKNGREYYWQWKRLLKFSNHSFS